MKELFFERRGIFYTVNDFQEGRPTIVFIHGLSGSSSAWFLFEKALKHRYNLLMLDLRGHGKSSKPRGYRAYDIRELTQDIAELTDHLGLRDFILVSHSFGTLVALEYLLAHQHNVARAIFLSPNYGVHRTRRARLSRPFLTAIIRIANVFPFSTKRGIRLDYSKYLNTGDWNLRRMAADISNTTLRVYLYCLEHTYKFNRDGWWSRINVSTLIVHGRDDSVIPVANAEQMAARIYDAELKVLDNADHMLVLNKVNEIAPVIETFLSEKRLNQATIDNTATV
ncbi:alpha/beta hydrolase [bacterium]|nr:alpha/beta hydrolase [bacterium]